MKFNIKVERVRSRWFHRKTDKVEQLRREIDEMYTKWTKQMADSHEQFNKLLDEFQKTSK